MTPGEEFVQDVVRAYDLAAHEVRLIELAGKALDTAMAAADELARHIEATGSVMLNDKIHPAQNVLRDQIRAYELCTRAAALPADVTGESVRRLRTIQGGA
jgi:hypothetical protein